MMNRMPEQRLISVGVECYAGHRGEQTPRTLILEDRRIGVAEVVDACSRPSTGTSSCAAQTAIRISFATMSEPTPGN
jgi:hypothetical protein